MLCTKMKLSGYTHCVLLDDFEEFIVIKLIACNDCSRLSFVFVSTFDQGRDLLPLEGCQLLVCGKMRGKMRDKMRGKDRILIVVAKAMKF